MKRYLMSLATLAVLALPVIAGAEDQTTLSDGSAEDKMVLPFRGAVLTADDQGFFASDAPRLQVDEKILHDYFSTPPYREE